MDKNNDEDEENPKDNKGFKKFLLDFVESFRPLCVTLNILFLILFICLAALGVSLKIRFKDLIENYAPRVAKEFRLTGMSKEVDVKMKSYITCVLSYSYGILSTVFILTGFVVAFYCIMGCIGVLSLNKQVLRFYSFMIDLHFFSMIAFLVYIILRPGLVKNLITKVLKDAEEKSKSDPNYQQAFNKGQSYLHSTYSCSGPSDCANKILDEHGKWIYLAPCIASLCILGVYIIFMASINLKYKLFDYSEIWSSIDEEDDDDD